MGRFTSESSRQLLVHSALSFLFNALILASAVAFVTTQLTA